MTPNLQARLIQLQRRAPPDRRQKTRMKTVPAPVGGWNARDAVDDMADDDAVELVNWFPGFGQVSTRNGFASHATGLGGSVEMLAEFNAGSTRKMIAGANGNIWDSTSAGAASSLAAGFASNRWQWAQFDDSAGGARIGFVNGSDAPQIYNGSTIAAMTISGTGLTPANLNGIAIHKNRSYFWDNRTQDFWYSALNALGGALTKFPLGRVTGTGGNLITVGTWTRDGGDGQDDVACFFLSSGDVVIYAGDNPGDSAAWGLVGVFKIGAPLGARAVQKIGSDLVVTTVDGYQTLSFILAKGRVNAKHGTISSKIRNAVLQATKLFASNFGWQIALYPIGNMALFNVPVSSSTFEQHVVNTESGAWCKFSGIDARCWGMYNDRMYLGGSGVVYKFDSGASDAGVARLCRAQTAWTYLGTRERQKRMAAMRPFLKIDGALTFSTGVGVDFGPVTLASVDSSIASIASPWDTSPWDTSLWSDEELVTDNWVGAEGIGMNVSTKLQISSSTRTAHWLATQYLYELGRGSF